MEMVDGVRLAFSGWSENIVWGGAQKKGGEKMVVNAHDIGACETYCWWGGSSPLSLTPRCCWPALFLVSD